MKKVTLLMALFAGLALNAQIYYQLPPLAGNPGGYNTPADGEQPVIAGATQILGQSLTPAWSPNQTIPFSFQFNSVVESSFKVSSTGVLTFTTSAASVPTSTPAVLPSASIPDKSIMTWGIEGVGANDAIATKVYGSAPNRQLWIMFLSYSVRGATAGSSNWTYYSIVLEEGSNGIYIVDQRINLGNGIDGCTIGVQINSVTAYQVAGSPNVAHLSNDVPDETDNKHYSFLPGPQPQYDLKGVKVNNPDVLNSAAAPFGPSIEVFNYGTQTVTSATANYTLNNGAMVSAPVTGLNIAPLTSANVVSSSGWTPTPGVYVLEMWLSNLNGNVDEKPANDKASKEIWVGPGLTPRVPLMETFTSSTCPPCVPANTKMEQIFAANPGEYVSLKYQMSWPGTGDPYYTLEGLTRRAYYGINSVPWMQIDGGWGQNGNNLTQAIFDQYQQVPGFINLSASYTVNGNTKTVSGTVTITPLVNISSELNLFIAIKENRTTLNIKSNGETEFFQVMKKMLPDGEGEALSGTLTANTPITKNFTYTFNGNYRKPNNAGDPINHAIEHSIEEFFDLSLAVWVQDVNTKRVYQAANGVQTQYIGIDETGIASSLNVYPNPATDVAYVSVNMANNAAARITLVNTLGQVVSAQTANLELGSNKVELNTSSLASGVYFVQVEIDGKIETVKLSVQ
jgi:hypothetical protein